MRKRLFWILFGVCLAGLAILFAARMQSDGDRFTSLTMRGNAYLEKGELTNAISSYVEALRLVPESGDAHLNLANAWLLAGNNQKVIEECREALSLDRNSGAAYYLMGCAYLHANQPEPAVQVFQQSQKIDPAVTALNFQLGLAQEKLGHLEAAAQEFETIVRFEPNHPSAHYQLSRLYERLGRANDAAQELQTHQRILATNPGAPRDAQAFERCKYTEPRIAFKLEQPDRQGTPVRFVEATVTAFGPHASRYRGPLAVLDYNHDGRNSLLVMEKDKGFRLLSNQQGHFETLGEALPAKPGAVYRQCVVGDLNNDGFEDVIVLGEQASHAFRFATNGEVREVTVGAGLERLQARDGLLADLDFTGKLDLLTVLPGGQGLRLYRNLGNFYFQENTTNSGLPAIWPGAEHVVAEDWQNEDLPGIFLTQPEKPPVFFAKQRAGQFAQTNSPAGWPAGTILATGDLNNDLRPDLVIVTETHIQIIFNGVKEQQRIPLNGFHPKGMLLVDYDNDGWLDLIAYGNGVRVWRNRGKAGFADVTAALGLDKLGPIDAMVAADFDNDGDTDFILSSTNGLQFWKNEGGNANQQLKLRLAGNRSNASALGVQIELAAGHWRTLRRVQQLPLEIGVGKHEKIDVVRVRWSDLTTTALGVPVQRKPLELVELTVPAGSCPYLYAWNGKRFGFATDILGASPLGLPLAEKRFIEADPQEFLALGNDSVFPARDGAYELRITEELREVLYLDQAQLVVVDHPAGTLVFPTSKLRPGKPFPPHELWTLRTAARLRHALRSDGVDVTEALAQTDGQMVSPIHLRQPQLRGLAEPFSVTMDFGELPADRPLVLVLNGWLRFGGGMANIAASLDPTLPFPFPTLEAELPDGSWKSVQTDVGAPAGKTKTILVDLEHKLAPGSRRLRLTTAFEIHWDSASLCEKEDSAPNRQIMLTPDRAEVRWRGFSQFIDLPAWLPLTPDYEKVQPTPPWSRTPAGWCTRYGHVEELIGKRDGALALLNGGDELALSFRADRLPPKPKGFVRDFFLHVVGWDKDADFHVAQGWQVEPLPFESMKDETYGRQPRPIGLNQDWIQKYNTRWTGPLVLTPKP